MLKQVRRIVTHNDESGKSEVMIDGIADEVLTVLTELWVTESGPHDHSRSEDMAKRSVGILPPKGGSVFRIFQIAPDSENTHMSWEERQATARQWFKEMKGGDVQPDTSRHEGMHTTDTTDYIMLLSGEITLVLDKEERDLKPFDVVVQRGTNHAWVNRGTEDAVLMAVLIDSGSA